MVASVPVQRALRGARSGHGLSAAAPSSPLAGAAARRTLPEGRSSAGGGGGRLFTESKILKHLAICVPALLSLAVALPAVAAERARDACFLRHDVYGFSAPNDHTVYLSVRNRDVFRLDLMNECQGLTFRQSFGLEDRPASPWVCDPLEATVVYRETGILQRCPVKAIHKLTPDEIKALPKRDRP